MDNRMIAKCMSLIESRYQMRNRPFTEPMAQIFAVMLGRMDTDRGCQAVMDACVDSPHPPEVSDIRRLYAEQNGMAPGETPDEALSRQAREKEFSSALSRDIQNRRTSGHIRLGSGPMPATPKEAHEILQRMKDRLAGRFTMPDQTGPVGDAEEVVEEEKVS